jgi:hypothetical protein
MTLKKIITPDRDLQLIQDNIDAALQPIQNASILNGILLEDVDLTTGVDNLVAHPLGRIPQLILIGVPDVNATIWSPVNSEIGNRSSSAQYINLQCSADCIVSMWVS